MPKGEKEIDYASMWAGMLPGQSITFFNVHRGAVITSFNSWCRVRCLDWKCHTAAEGDRGAGKPPKRVIVTRTDNMDPIEAAALQAERSLKCYWEINTRTHRYHIQSDGRREREVWKAQKSRRATRHQWEHLEVGQIRLVRSKIHPLKHSIIKACYIRDLERRFLARKVSDPLNQNDNMDWFRVERVSFDLKELPMPDYFLLSDDR